MKQLVDSKDITMIDIQKRFSDRDDVQSIVDELIKQNVIEYINEKFLIKDAKAGFNDGRVFGTGGEGFMRINVACPRSVVEKVLLQIQVAVAGR